VTFPFQDQRTQRIFCRSPSASLVKHGKIKIVADAFFLRFRTNLPATIPVQEALTALPMEQGQERANGNNATEQEVAPTNYYEPVPVPGKVHNTRIFIFIF
jgi:hypothetical protein